MEEKLWLHLLFLLYRSREEKRREEIREWSDRIVGIVSEIPEYEEWGTGKVKVNGRIWIKVK